LSIAAQIDATLALPSQIVQGYLQDLTDDELFVRPYDSMNHIAWQLGHLIVGENSHINQVYPGSMPALPTGFAEKHTPETAASDQHSDFHTKAEYLKLLDQQRAATLALLADLSDEELSKPSPESMRYFGQTIGAVFAGEATHWMMHAGQWAVVRRKLGRPPLF
jgi:uncharacterized damage-inducible protein DinB